MLPLDIAAAGLKLADWDDALLKSADELAMQIIRAYATSGSGRPRAPA